MSKSGGSEKHIEAIKKFKRRKLSRFNLENAEWEFNINLESDIIGIVGILDAALVKENLYYPIEFKTNIGKTPYSHYIQLFAYAICLEEKEILGDFGFICSTANLKIEKVIWQKDIKKQILFYVNTIKKNIEKGILPISSANLTKCSQCEYFRYCNDREI